jgi:hypothetical protein
VIKKQDGDKDSPSNFRPISNLKVIGKIIESAAANRLCDQLLTNSYLHHNQSSYRQHHSTETATLSVLNDWRLSIDRGCFVCVASLDVSSAFDTIHHKILLNRLMEAGVLGKAHKWFRSYLNDRTARVKYGESQAVDIGLTHGIPQGSVLGPILFNIYMANLAHKLDLKRTEYTDLNFHIYADDVLLYISCKPDSLTQTAAKMSNIIEMVNEWMKQNSLLLNVDKTDLFLIHSSRKSVNDSPVISIGGNRMTFRTSGSMRWLGVEFDAHLKMDEFVRRKCGSCYGILRMIGRIRRSLNKPVTTLLCNALVLSRLDYCNSLLHNVDKHLINKMQRVMNLAVRIITKRPRTEHITPLLKELEWLSVENKISMKIALLVYKILKCSLPHTLYKHLTVYKPRRQLRSMENTFITLELSSASKSVGRGAWSICAPAVWNCLPADLRTSGVSFSAFRVDLLSWLLNQ